MCDQMVCAPFFSAVFNNLGANLTTLRLLFFWRFFASLNSVRTL